MINISDLRRISAGLSALHLHTTVNQTMSRIMTYPLLVSTVSVVAIKHNTDDHVNAVSHLQDKAFITCVQRYRVNLHREAHILIQKCPICTLLKSLERFN